MKIAFIEPGLHVCGGIRRIMETSNRLVARGHTVVIFTPRGRPCTWLPHDSDIRRMADLERDTFDVVIFNLAEQYKYALVAKAPIKVFWVLAAEAEYKIPEIPIKALKQDFYFLANSKFVVKYIKKHRPDIDYAIPITPGGINPDHFKYVPAISKTKHVLYYGSARPWKGTTLIENALQGTKLSSLKMEGLGTPQNQLYHLYNTCNIYISACQVEGFNFPILEAMACGCPVVCTDDGGNQDFVKANVNALVVPRRVKSIRQGILALTNDKDLQRRLRTEGLKTAQASKYDWNNVVAKVENLLLGQLENGN